MLSNLICTQTTPQVMRRLKFDVWICWQLRALKAELRALVSDIHEVTYSHKRMHGQNF